MVLRLAIFDCDGTLVDSQADITLAMEAAFAAHALPAPPRAQIRRSVGLSLAEAIRRLSPDCDAETGASLVQAYKDAFRARRAGCWAWPRAKATAAWPSAWTAMA